MGPPDEQVVDGAELERIARSLGLERALAADPDAFAAALKGARALAARAPLPALYDEPAHVCRFDRVEDDRSENGRGGGPAHG